MAGPLKILVVDDDDTIRGIVARLLRSASWDVTESRDGEEAWGAFVTAQADGPFDGVVTDVSMPRMDGLALASRIRRTDPDVPIVFLTSHDEADVVKGALRAGASDYFEKTAFDADELLERIRALLAFQQNGRSATKTARGVRDTYRSLAAPLDAAPFQIALQPFSDAGGDVFRRFAARDGGWLLVLADVAGHSVESSYAVASFLGQCSEIAASGASPSECVRSLNASIARGPFREHPVCALIGLWDMSIGRLHFANAGIPNIFVYRRTTQTVEVFELESAPLGFFDEPAISEHVLMLGEGDRVLIGSDGLVDTLSGSQGADLDSVVRMWATMARLQSLRDALAGFVGRVSGLAARKRGDDLLAVAFEQPPAAPKAGWFLKSFPASLSEIDRFCGEFAVFLKSSFAGLDEKRLFDVGLAVREAALNAVEHGAHFGEAERVSVWSAVIDDGRELRVGVVDGNRTPWTLSGPALDEDLPDRGRGGLIIQHMASSFEQIPGELSMRFQLRSE